MADNVGYEDDDSGGNLKVETQKAKGDIEEIGNLANEIKMEEKGDRPPLPFAGMPKEVLLLYSRQRKYMWAREILTAIVFLTTLILLALVIAVVAISPPCLEFWQTSPIYRVYPKSFRSSDNDLSGYGDLNGIVENLDYLNDELGVEILSLGSVFESPRIEQSDYDISDFKQIDSAYGTMEDMENLIIEVHDRGMKIVMDFVPNHSSDQHKWFLAGSNTSHPQYETYKDYYVWLPGADASDVPNNWVTEIGDQSAWTWNDDRKEFYYHSFSSAQPDLNVRNSRVREELKDILRFWLEKGIDGFRVVGTAFLVEASHFRDNPLVNSSASASKENLHSDYTQNYQGVHDLVVEWRKVLDEYSTEPGIYRFLEVQSTGDLETTLRYYGTDLTREADFPLNNQFASVPTDEWTAGNVGQRILDWMQGLADGKWPNWVLSDGENSRIASRAVGGNAVVAAVVAMTLPGTPSIYYGDEIGMTDSSSSSVNTPMQWSSESNAGFCGNCTPWTPPNDNYMDGVTVQNQTDDETSMLSIYKELTTLRVGIIFQRGYFCMLGSTNGVLRFVRELEGLRSVLVLANFESQTSSPLNLTTAYSALPASGTVELFTGTDGSLKQGKEVQLDGFRLPPHSAAVISYDPVEMVHRSPTMTERCFVHLKLRYNSALQIIQYN